jgi:general secretion pathway protein G
MASRIRNGNRQSVLGFTFMELLMVMAMIALLVTIALPRYFDGLNRSKEAILHEDLATMRDAIDHYHADKGIYPQSLDELVTMRYLRFIPEDPITERTDTWRVTPPPDLANRVYDVHSGANGTASDGTPYQNW